MTDSFLECGNCQRGDAKDAEARREPLLNEKESDWPMETLRESSRALRLRVGSCCCSFDEKESE